MIEVGGVRRSPVEIETRPVEHPAVRDAAAVGRADGDGLTKPEAHVAPEDPAAAGDSLARTLLDRCKAGLAPYKTNTRAGSASWTNCRAPPPARSAASSSARAPDRAYGRVCPAPRTTYL